MIKVEIKIEDVMALTATRKQDVAVWIVDGLNDGQAVQFGATDEQMGAIAFLAIAGNPGNSKLNDLLYELMTDEQKFSGLVP